MRLSDVIVFLAKFACNQSLTMREKKRKKSFQKLTTHANKFSESNKMVWNIHKMK